MAEEELLRYRRQDDPGLEWECASGWGGMAEKLAGLDQRERGGR